MRKNRMTKKRNGGGRRWDAVKSFFRRKSKVAPISYALPKSATPSNYGNYNTTFATFTNSTSPPKQHRTPSRKRLFRGETPSTTSSYKYSPPNLSHKTTYTENFDDLYPYPTKKTVRRERVPAFNDVY
jgi:hypothetical protein